jgi:hypothetical protein
MVKALKSPIVNKDRGLLTGLLTHNIVQAPLNLIQGSSPLSFINSRPQGSFRLVNQLKTLTQLCFEPACHPVAVLSLRLV